MATLFETGVRKVSDRDCEQWLAGFQKAYVPSVVNNAIGLLRAVFQEAIGAGARFNNPAGGLSRTKVRGKLSTSSPTVEKDSLHR
jgi:hypothetical protein